MGGEFMKSRFHAVSIVVVMLSLSACGGLFQKPEPDPDHGTLPDGALRPGDHGYEGSHRWDDTRIYPTESPSPAEQLQNPGIAPVNGGVSFPASQELDHALQSAQNESGDGSRIDVKVPHSMWSRLELKIYDAMIATAKAVEKAPRPGKKDPIHSLTTFGRERMKKFAMNDRDALALFNEVDTVQLQGVKKNGKSFVRVAFKGAHGQSIDAVADTRADRFCEIADRALPTDQKLTFMAKHDGKNVKMRHPFGGKACSEAVLGDYKIYNFDLGSDAKDGMPSVALMVSKDNGRTGSWAFFADPKEVGGANSLMPKLQAAFAEPLKSARTAKF
jgi:hypothetical protein